jgi:adenylosuccinate synthase
LNKLSSEGKKILAEGAQGTMLDLDFGSYPFVTSSSTISAGAFTGLGISPKRIGEVFGIFKAYCTRVGSGPFPTELNDTTGELIRKKGCEYGATTGRPRRCGWLDIPALKYAIMVNGVTKLFMMKSDILSGFKTVKVCTKYLVEGKQQTEILFDNNAQIDPVYTEFIGWDEDISGIKEFKSLPENLRHYIEFIEEQTGIPVTLVSVGPDRNSTIFR